MQTNIVVTQNKWAIEHLDESESQQARKWIRTVLSDSTDTDSVTCTSSNLWHLRYGHALSITLQKLKRIRSTFDSSTCIPCIEAKKTRQPFLSSDFKVTDKLSQIHSDICSQYPESEGNSIYNLTFLDELTHYAWTHSIPNKASSTVAQEFSRFVATVKRETGLKIKCLQTDEGGEYQGYLTSILQTLGIKYETTPPRTPQLNGKAERLNCTLNEAVRAMLYQANMPQSFWAEAMATAIYLKNWLPSDAINDGIPMERWTGMELTVKELQFLKPFGCIVYDYVNKQTHGIWSKIKPTGTRGCFVGYVSSSSYKYWNFTWKCFVVSHDLTFKGTEFPQALDFDQPPANAPSAPVASPPIESLSSQLEFESRLTVIYDEIAVLQPPIGYVFTIHGPLAHSDPVSFKEAMSHSDSKLW